VTSDLSTRYPAADRNSELQLLSFVALNAALPVNRFVFRREGDPDAGVDGHLELKKDGRYLNLRSHVQVKSTDSAATNADGSVSVPVQVNNLRYLLNGPSSLYVLFIAPTGELRYVWARDEQKRLDQVNPEWMQQEEVTLRFQHVLNDAGLTDIYDRIQKEAQLSASVAEILSKASNTDSVVIGIEKATLGMTDAAEAEKVLGSSGTLLVTAGHAERVLELAALLDPEKANLARILLVRAYAEHVLGRYLDAYALLSRALLNRKDLSDDDQQFLEFMRDSCEYHAGRLTLNEFNERLEQRTSNPNSRFATSYRINQLSNQILMTPDIDARQQLLNHIRSIVANVINATDTSNAFKLYARRALLEAEGQQLTLRFSRESIDARIKLALGHAVNVHQMLARYASQFSEWDKAILELIDDAVRIGHSLLICDAILARLTTIFYSLTLQRQFGKMFPLTLAIADAEVDNLITSLEDITEQFVQARQYEGELRAKMLLADLQEFQGQVDRAKEIALDVKVRAEVLGYAIPLARSQEHLADKGPQALRDAVMRPRSDEERVLSNAEMKDEELKAYALQALELDKLPRERLPVLEREYLSIREVARARRDWCRHLDRLSDDRHMARKSTKFRSDPNKIGECKLHGYRSLIPNPDWAAVFSAFKRTYCDACPDRNPFGTGN
jgi:hypothetical protein